MRQSIYFYIQPSLQRNRIVLWNFSFITTDIFTTNGGLFLSSGRVVDVKVLKSPALNYKLGDVLPQFLMNFDSKEDRLQTDPIYL